MTSELFVTGGFRKPSVRKNLFENNYEREKDPYLQFHKLYDNTWVITSEFCSINLAEGEANENREKLFSFMILFMRRRIEKIRMRSNIHYHLYKTVAI